MEGIEIRNRRNDCVASSPLRRMNPAHVCRALGRPAGRCTQSLLNDGRHPRRRAGGGSQYREGRQLLYQSLDSGPSIAIRARLGESYKNYRAMVKQALQEKT